MKASHYALIAFALLVGWIYIRKGMAPASGVVNGPLPGPRAAPGVPVETRTLAPAPVAELSAQVAKNLMAGLHA